MLGDQFTCGRQRSALDIYCGSEERLGAPGDDEREHDRVDLIWVVAVELDGRDLE